MMEELKRYRRKVSLRLGRAMRAGKLDEEIRRSNAEADRIWKAALAEIRRQDATATRRSRKASACTSPVPKRTRSAARAPKRKRA